MSIDATQQSQQLSALPPGKTGVGGPAHGRDTMAPGDGAAKAAENGDEDEGLSFWDLLDVINPLQHIPIISTIYREVTGDRIGDAARIAGGALFGGPIGLAAAGVNFAVKAFTGKNIDEQVMAMMGLGDTVTAEGTAVAEAAQDVDTAAARAPATVEKAPLETQAATAPPTDATAPGKPLPQVTGKWFPLDGSERRDPFMPLGAQAKLEHTLRARQTSPKADPVVIAPSGNTPQETATGKTAPPGTELRQAGTVEVNPMGRPTAAYLPLGLLQGAPEPASPAGQTLRGQTLRGQTLQPPAEAVRHAARAQGLDPARHPALADAMSEQSNPTPDGPPPTRADASPGNAITVPAWFDTAMQKALTAYEKTGRLSGDAEQSGARERSGS